MAMLMLCALAFFLTHVYWSQSTESMALSARAREFRPPQPQPHLLLDPLACSRVRSRGDDGSSRFPTHTSFLLSLDA